MEKFGKLAQQYGHDLPLKVMRSNAGFYLGTSQDGMPFSRESAEYFETQGAADEALATGKWTQRPTA